MLLRIFPPPSGQDALPLIQRTLNGVTKEDVTLSFAPGRYLLLSPLEIKGKTRLTLDGGGCVLSPQYDREDEYEKSADCFHIEGCESLTLKNFIIDASLPANSAGRIERINADSLEIRMNSRVPFTGRERFIDGMTFDEEGMPMGVYWFQNRYDPARRTIIEGELACTAPRRLEPEHEYLGNQRFRFPADRETLERLKPGTLLSVSHTYYGLAAFTFRNCRNVTIQDVDIQNFGGFGFLILPRSADFSFRRVRLRSADFPRQLYGVTADGIHTVGIGGKLTVEDCVFERLGDDSINVHTQVMTVQEAGPSIVRLRYDKVGGIVSPNWLMPGDALWAYDPVTLRKKGEIIAGEVQGQGVFQPENDVSFLCPRDFVTNRAYFPDVVFRGNVVRHCRGRGCCFQGVSSLLVENCVIGPARGPAVYLSTAFNEWKEAGPLQTVTIRENEFIGAPSEAPSDGTNLLRGGCAILMWLRGEQYVSLPDVHQNITIESNRFVDLSTRHALYLSSAAGVRVQGNRFIRCHFASDPIRIEHCSDVQAEN